MSAALNYVLISSAVKSPGCLWRGRCLGGLPAYRYIEALSARAASYFTTYIAFFGRSSTLKKVLVARVTFGPAAIERKELQNKNNTVTSKKL